MATSSGAEGMKVKRKNLVAARGAVFAAVHGDEDGHGYEGEFPEAVVDHQVQRDEDAVHGGLLEKEQRVVDLFASLDGFPTGENADGTEEANEDD